MLAVACITEATDWLVSRTRALLAVVRVCACRQLPCCFCICAICVFCSLRHAWQHASDCKQQMRKFLAHSVAQ